MTFLVLLAIIGFIWVWWRSSFREEELQREINSLKRELGRLDSALEALRVAQEQQRSGTATEVDSISTVRWNAESTPTASPQTSVPTSVPPLPATAARLESEPARADLVSPFPRRRRTEEGASLPPLGPAAAEVLEAAKRKVAEPAASSEAPVAAVKDQTPEPTATVLVAVEPAVNETKPPLITAPGSPSCVMAESPVGEAAHLVTDQPTAPPKHAAVPGPAAVPATTTPRQVDDHQPTPISPAPSKPAPTRSPHPAPTPAPKKSPTSFWTDLEKSLGGGLLNKIGVGVLVIGFSLLLGYTFQHLGPAGKIGIGYLVVAALLGGGIHLERKPVYSLYGKGLIGGGWALAYFTTYALHFLPAVRLIEREWLGLVLLLLAAAGMIAHSLKYKSPIVTGLAYALGFVTILLSHATLFSLTSTLLLSISLVVICLRLGWFHLLLFAPVAAYGCHLAWLHPRLQESKFLGQHLEHSTWSAALIAAYWILLLVPNYLGRDHNTPAKRGLRLLVNLLNLAGFFGLLAYQSQYPQYRFAFLLAVGAIYVGLGALSRRHADLLTMRLFVTLGASLLIAAVPVRLTGNWVAYLWLLEAEALLISGFLLGDRYFRALGALALALLYGRLFVVDVHDSSTFTLSGVRVYSSAVAFAFTSAGFYCTHHWLYRRFRAAISTTEWNASRCFSYAAAFLAVVAVALQKPTVLLAAAWCVLAVALVEIGRVRRNCDLRTQGYFTFLVAVVRLAEYNYTLDTPFFFATQRFWTVTLAACLLYYLSIQVGRAYRRVLLALPDEAVRRTALYVAAALLAVLVWFEAPPALAAPAWGLMALALSEIGRWRKSADLKVQAYLVVLVGLGRLIEFHFGLEEPWHFASVRLWTVGFYAALLYYLARDRKRAAPAPAGDLPVSDPFADWETVPRRILLYVASALVAVLIWLEASPALIAPGLGLMALVLFEVGKWRRSIDLRLQGYLVVLVGFVRLVQFNFTLAEPYRFASVRLWTVGFFAVLLYYLYRRLAPADRRRALLPDSDDTPRELFEAWHWNPRSLFLSQRPSSNTTSAITAQAGAIRAGGSSYQSNPATSADPA